MKKTVLTSQTKEPNSIVLIVDKIGVVGEKLAKEFSKDFYVILFSGRTPFKENNKIAFIKFKNKIPKIPQNKYSKIFLVDDGKSITRQSSFSFIKEAKRLSADFYFLGSVRNFDIKHTDELVKTYEKVKVLVFGDLFDEEFLFDHDTSITKFILEAGNKKRIKVPGEGLSLSYPIGLSDTIKLILKATYLKIPQKIILLFYKNPITDMSLAHLFQKIDPDIKVDFTPEFRNQDFFIPEGAEFSISKYDLKTRIEELDFNKTKKFLNKNNETKKYILKFYKIFGFIILLISFLAILPFIATNFYLNLAERQLESANSLSSEYIFSKALKKANDANAFFNLAKSTNLIFTKQLDLINNSKTNKLESKIQYGLISSSYQKNIFESALIFENIYKNKSISPKEDFINVIQLIKSTQLELEKLNIENVSKDFDENVSVIKLLTKVSDILPEVLGFENEKAYLLLFQDSNELRPGGGKITSVAKIDIKNGTLSSFEILDTKELDENLKIYIEPPFAVRRYLPSTDYFLKDSNFNPDFVESAITASTIYSLESGEQVDGVIGVDLYFLQNLLEKLGPIYMKEVGKNITSENIQQVSSEFNNIKNNESFITLLLKNMELNLNEKSKLSPFLILEIVEKAIKEKHILFAFKDKDVQNVFTTNNLSGSLIDKRSKSENKINDVFGLFEANLGLNKINYYISRSISKKSIIDKNGDMTSEVTIAFKNSSQKGSSLAKTYKNYMQVILPNEVKISEVSVAGKKQELVPAISDYKIYENPRFSSPKELEIDQAIDSNRSIVGFLVSVAPDSIQTVKLNYSSSFKVSTESNSRTDYSLLVFKQPGISSFPLNLIFEENNEYLVLPQNSYSLEIKNDEIIESTIIKK